MFPAPVAPAPYLDEPLDPEDFEIAVQAIQMVDEPLLPPPSALPEPDQWPFGTPFDKDAA